MEEEYLIKKWLADELSDAEREEFKKLDDYDLNLEILENAKYFKASHFSSVKSYNNYKKDLKDKKTPVIKLSNYKVLFRIAALFVISLSIYFAFFFNNLTTVQTLANNNTTFELPDASTVVLNAESKADYSINKWSQKREVSLDGEAFFKVAKGSKFDVVTTGGIVSVVGTQFNVKNRENYFEVKCYEGIVSVNSNGRSQQLTKGNTYRILNNIISVDSTNTNQPKWIDNISSFKSVPLYEVLNELERQYDVIIVAEKIDTQRLFTGGFVHNNIEQALTSITVPFDLDYKQDQSNKIILFTSD
jgi:ferric-dicitrate binding protein FerR (iron transport regulator)